MIARNAGAGGSIVLAKVRESNDKNYGYNALTDVYEDLVKSGVIDPTKVTRTALAGLHAPPAAPCGVDLGRRGRELTLPAPPGTFGG